MANGNLPSTQKLNVLLPNAASRIASIPKVTPEVMMIVYLDEVAGRLAEIQEVLAEVVAEGHLESMTLNITDNPQRVPIYSRHISIHNNGDDGIYIFQNKMKPLSKDAVINKNGNLNIDFQTRRIRDFWFACASGETATVRAWTW